MPSALQRASDAFLNLFRSKPLVIPPEALKFTELSPADYQPRVESYPQIPIAGWDGKLILQMLDQNSVGNFQASELFYHALTKEGLIGAALDMRRETLDDFSWVLQCPKDAPDEMHIFTEALARDWQSVMPDAVRGEIVERTNVFGFMVCRVQWTQRSGQKQPILHPWTHSNLSYRPELSAPDNPVFQGISVEKGLEIIRNDGREWVIFTLGGTRPWLKGMLRKLAFVLFGIITGDDRWLNFNDKFAEPLKRRVVPRLMREGQEVQRLYSKEERMRGGDMVLCPQDETGHGYDISYVQVDAKGFETLEKQLQRFDERAAIIILGHNILQSLQGGGGSRAAMSEARKFLRTKGRADSKLLTSGFVDVSKVWARANFGEDPDDFPELGGRLPESVSWSVVFDLSDPEAKQQAAVEAAQYSQGFGAFCKGLQAAGMTIDQIQAQGVRIDWAETAARCGIALMGGEDSYTEHDADEAELSAEEHIDPPAYVKAAARRSLTWVQQLGRGGAGTGREMARKIVRGQLTRADVLHIAKYWPHHEHDRESPNWANLTRPSNARIAWGLWGDSGDGRGRKWSETKARDLRAAMSPDEARLVNTKLALLDDESQPGAVIELAALPAIARRAILRQRNS